MYDLRPAYLVQIHGPEAFNKLDIIDINIWVSQRRDSKGETMFTNKHLLFFTNVLQLYM